MARELSVGVAVKISWVVLLLIAAVAYYVWKRKSA